MDFKELSAKKKVQSEGKEAARQASYNVSMIITMGVGKAKMLIDLAEEIRTKYNIKRILYLCNSTKLRDSEEEGFPEQLNKWGNPVLNSLIHCECYQTAYKWQDTEWDLVLGDEIDFAITSKYIRFFFNNKMKFKILVSGTLAQEKKILLEHIAPIKFIYDTEQGEKDGVINKTRYYAYNYKMTDKESEKYRKLSERVLVEWAQADKDKKRLDFWTRKRKHFLNSLDSSVVHCKKIVNKFYERNTDPRIIIFSELQQQSDRVCEHSFHGENEQEQNLTKFQNGDITVLSVVSKITRGINLKRARIAIFEGFSGSSTAFGQRSGRMKRLEVNDFATVIFMVPWYKKGEEYSPTVVDRWMKKATSNLNIQIKDLKL